MISQDDTTDVTMVSQDESQDDSSMPSQDLGITSPFLVWANTLEALFDDIPLFDMKKTQIWQQKQKCAYCTKLFQLSDGHIHFVCGIL